MKLYRFFFRSLSEELIFLIRLMQRFNQNIERYKDNKFLRKINSLLVFLLHKRIFRKFACDITPSCKLGNVVFRHPTGIVIGGGVSAAGEFLLKGVREEFEKNVFPPIKDSTVLALAELGNDAGVIGAASLVLIGKS